MLKGKTKTGFEFEIDRKLLENYELIEVLAEVDDNPLVMPKLLKMMLGDEKEKLIEHVRDEDGIVSIYDLAEELIDIFHSSSDDKQVKNS